MGRRGKASGRWTCIAAVTLVFTMFRPGSGHGGIEQAAFDEIRVVSQWSALRVHVQPWGPSEQEINAQRTAILTDAAHRGLVDRARSRLLSFEILGEHDPAKRFAPPNRYRATIYDYVRDQAFVAEGRMGVAAIDVIGVDDTQPLPTYEEFREAVRFVRRDAVLGVRLEQGMATAYPPMPPLLSLPGVGRVLAVGLRPSESTDMRTHEIVGVVMNTGTVVRFPTRAPPRSAATEDICRIAEAGQRSSTRGEAGQALVTIMDDGRVLWRFVVIRPSSSSGTNGSGIELRHVDYLGRRVLERAHAPILNVKYEEGGCGPFRDWLYQESWFDADGNASTRGFTECIESPRTIAESASDVGTFQGVAIRAGDTDVSLVSETEAGWYRYVSEWRLASDGTIRPRFHFAAVANSCTCLAHNHHVYWRFDFAIAGQPNDSVARRNVTSDPATWQPISTEAQIGRDPEAQAEWKVQDADGAGYVIRPGPGDGFADSYGVGDVWVLRSHADEIDDGVGFTTDEQLSRAHIDDFVDGEDVYRQDVTVWYAAHTRHSADDLPGYDVGPELTPEGW